MNGSAELWLEFALDAVEGPDDLDARLDLAIESAAASAGAAARLAAALGIGLADLRRRAGVPVAAAVAAARLSLIEAALAECLRCAEAGDGPGLRHAVAVCAALQWDALGDATASALAFLRREAVTPSADRLAAAVCAAAPLGRRAALARIRSLAVAAAAAA